MNKEKKDQQSADEGKYGGGKHIFLFLGIAVIVVVLLKYLLDWIMK